MPRLLTAFALASLAALTLTACNSHPLPDACYQKPESGRCRAAFTRYYFDDKFGQCKAFIWGGCQGVVPFETVEDCRTQCRAPAELAPEAMPSPEPAKQVAP